MKNFERGHTMYFHQPEVAETQRRQPADLILVAACSHIFAYDNARAGAHRKPLSPKSLT
jgi:hypothetical protein